MTWVAVGVTAAGTIKGGLDANAARKQQKKQDKYRKAAITYSPWTGMGDPGAGNFGNQDALSGALGGGLQGFAMGSQINSLAGAGAAAPQTKDPFAGVESPWKSMSNQMQQQQTVNPNNFNTGGSKYTFDIMRNPNQMMG